LKHSEGIFLGWYNRPGTKFKVTVYNVYSCPRSAKSQTRDKKIPSWDQKKSSLQVFRMSQSFLNSGDLISPDSSLMPVCSDSIYIYIYTYLAAYAAHFVLLRTQAIELGHPFSPVGHTESAQVCHTRQLHATHVLVARDVSREKGHSLFG